MMKISHHARKRRSAKYNTIRREIADGITISSEIARTLLNRADNRRFKESEDRFILTKDLLGLYILTRMEDDRWLAVTYIDLSDSLRQELLHKMYGDAKDISEFDFSLSKAILMSYSLEQIDEIKKSAVKYASRFRHTEEFPRSVCFAIDFGIEEGSDQFRVTKSAEHRKIKVSMIA